MHQRLYHHDQTQRVSVSYDHHIASNVVCKSLTLTLKGCRRGMYSVSSQRMGTRSSCPVAHEHRVPMLFNCIYIYSFIPLSGCVGMGPSALLFPKARDTVKTALLLLLLSKKQQRGSHHVKCYGNVVVQIFQQIDNTN